MVDLTLINTVVVAFVALIIAVVVLRGIGIGRITRSIRNLISSDESRPRNERNENNMSSRIRPPRIGGYGKLKLLLGIAAFIVVVVVAAKSIVIVDAGYEGVVLTLGAVERLALDPGLHTITPFTQEVVPMEVRTLKYEAVASAASKDLQSVSTKISINFHPIASEVPSLYATLGENYVDRVIQPAIQEGVKASTAKFSSEELVTNRPIAKQAIEDVIRISLKDRPLVIEQVYITDFEFDKAFQAQADAKAKAYQDYLTAQNTLLKAQVDANQTVVKAQADAQANIATKQGEVIQAQLAAEAAIAKAKGDAEAIRLLNEQLQNSPNYLQLQYIQHWNGALPYYWNGGGGSNPIFTIPINTPPPATPN